MLLHRPEAPNILKGELVVRKFRQLAFLDSILYFGIAKHGNCFSGSMLHVVLDLTCSHKILCPLSDELLLHTNMTFTVSEKEFDQHELTLRANSG
jgi:hypothetical protein